MLARVDAHAAAWPRPSPSPSPSPGTPPVVTTQAKYVGTGHPDTNRFEWNLNIKRDTYASFIGHHSLSAYHAIAENESIGRVKYGFKQVCGAEGAWGCCVCRRVFKAPRGGRQRSKPCRRFVIQVRMQAAGPCCAVVTRKCRLPAP